MKSYISSLMKNIWLIKGVFRKWYWLQLIFKIQILVYWQDVWESWSAHVGEWLYTIICTWYICEGSSKSDIYQREKKISCYIFSYMNVIYLSYTGNMWCRLSQFIRECSMYNKIFLTRWRIVVAVFHKCNFFYRESLLVKARLTRFHFQWQMLLINCLYPVSMLELIM